MSESSEGTTEETTEAVEETAPEEKQESKSEPTEHFDRLQARMDEMAESQRQFIESLQQQPEDEDQYPLEAEDAGFEEQEAKRMLDEMVEQRVQDQMTPYLQAQQMQARDTALADVEARYPEIVDPKVGQPVLDSALALVQEMGRPDLVNTPTFAKLVEQTYKAMKADESAARETPAGGRQQVHLEQGGGAAPSEPDEDIVARILGAGTPSNPLI